MEKETRIERIKDYEQIKEVMQRCGDDFFDQKLNNEDTIQKLAEKFFQHAEFLTAICQGELAGFIAYYLNRETKIAYISMIIIQNQYQGHGIGSSLLRVLVEDCVKAEQKKIRLEVACNNEKAICFYTKKGFFREGKASGKSDYYCYLVQPSEKM